MKIFYFLPLLSINVLFAQTLTPPDFSKPGGFYEEEFQLELSHQDPEAVIIYTLDGSEPEIDNLDGKTYTYKKRYQQFVGESPYEFYENILKTNLYQESLTIYDRTVDENRIANISTSYESNPYFPQENVDKSFVVRAKTILGEETSETVTNIYFINKNYTLPIVNLNLDDDLLFGYENGLFVAGKVFDQWRENNPSLETNLWTPANYWSSGSSSEIKLNFVYFDQNQEKINQYAGLRIQGNGS